MADCLFCNIVTGDIPATIVYSDEFVVGFEDINAAAPQHLLFIPREHISTSNDIDVEHESLVGKLFRAAGQTAKKRGFAQNGYRLVMNCNEDGGQTVYHIHLHCLAGRSLAWPPG